MRRTTTGNEYQQVLADLFDRTPKTVFAALAVSGLTSGGDYLAEARDRVIREWWTLHRNGIVPQRPPFPEPPAPAEDEG